jgi:hypothetical protein
MAVHWVNNKQVTIFTGVVYFINRDGKLDQKSYAIISDTEHHGTMEVHWCAKLKQQCKNLADSHEIAEKEVRRSV